MGYMEKYSCMITFIIFAPSENWTEAADCMLRHTHTTMKISKCLLIEMNTGANVSPHSSLHRIRVSYEGHVAASNVNSATAEMFFWNM